MALAWLWFDLIQHLVAILAQVPDLLNGPQVGLDEPSGHSGLQFGGDHRFPFRTGGSAAGHGHFFLPHWTVLFEARHCSGPDPGDCACGALGAIGKASSEVHLSEEESFTGFDGLQ